MLFIYFLLICQVILDSDLSRKSIYRDTFFFSWQTVYFFIYSWQIHRFVMNFRFFLLIISWQIKMDFIYIRDKWNYFVSKIIIFLFLTVLIYFSFSRDKFFDMSWTLIFFVTYVLLIISWHIKTVLFFIYVTN